MRRSPPGDAVSSRLAARSDPRALERRSLAGGGEVFTGPLAARALKALGARAMTVDRSIVVGDDFDPGEPESQALVAHEQVHLAGSGGQGSSVMRDAEEVAARAAERMVLQRAMRPVREGRTSGTRAGAAASAAPSEGGTQPSAARGYQALVAEGLDQSRIVERLAQACTDRLDEEERVRLDRAGHLKGSF